MPEVSLITALHNCVDLTRGYLESLQTTLKDADWELILVDDASTDGTADYLNSLHDHPRIRVFHNESNQGYAASNNRGASEARSPLLAFLNNDLSLTEGWFDKMLEVLNTAEHPGIIGNIQINPNTGLTDHAGVFFGLDGMPRQARKNRARLPKSRFTEWNAVTAACMLMPKSIFDSCGGFDETYRNGFEDIDLCVRVRELGYRIYVANRSRIFHHVSVSPGRHHHNDRNSELFRTRWTEKTREWGQTEWAPEYLRRYARHWWKFTLGKWWKAPTQVWNDRKSHRLTYRD